MKNIFSIIKPVLTKHKPELLVGMGLASMLFGTGLAIKATNKSVKQIEKKSSELERPLNKKEVISLVWKNYIPSVVSLTTGIGCVVASNRVSNTRNMAIATAYSLSETALKEYQDKTKELIGDKKYEKLQESVSQSKVTNTSVPSTVTILGEGESLFLESFSGRYFKANWNNISKAANELNAKAIASMNGVILLGDWYSALGLEPTELDSELGWDITDGTHGTIDVKIDSVLTPENKPCGVIRYNNRPKTL